MRGFVVGLMAAVTALTPATGASPTAVASAPPSRIDPSAIAAANRLLDAMEYDQLLDRTMAAVIAEAERTIPARLEAASEEPMPEDLRAKLSAAIGDSMRRLATANRPELRKGTALIYARHFTVAEIDRMIVLMRDPVMVKMQAEMPQIMAESMALSRASIDSEMPRMLEQLKSVIEEHLRTNGQDSAT